MPNGRRWPVAALIIGAVFVLLRAPSVVEPPAFNDEGTYADIGWALDHGAVLYRDVWDNKPPGVYWLAAAINLVHTSVLAFHILVALVVAATAVALWLLCRRLASSRVAWGATFAFVVLASLPTLAGDVLNAEGIGALLVVLAVLIVARPGGATRFPALAAGVLLGAGLLFKATFVADLVAVVTLPVWIAAASARPLGRRDVAAAAGILAGAAVVLIGVTAGLGAGGSLPGLLDVLTRQDFTYLHAASAGASAIGTSAASTAGTALTALTVSRVAIVLIAGGAATWWLARRHHLAATVGVWWLAWDLAAVMLSARGLVQYAQQAEPAVCLCTAVAADAALRTVPLRTVAVALIATVAGWATCVAALVAPTAEVALVVQQPLSPFVSAIISPRAITHYLGRGWERILGALSTAGYDAGFGNNQPALVRTAVTVIDAHSGAADRVFVWGRLPWAYALSARRPAGRYVSLNAAYVLDPGSEARLVGELARQPPAVLVALDPIPAPVTSMLQRWRYTQIVTPLNSAPNGRVVSWIAPWQ